MFDSEFLLIDQVELRQSHWKVRRIMELRDAVAEGVGTAGVALRPGHIEQPCGGQCREARQRLSEERHVGVELGGTSRALVLALDRSLAQHPLDGAMMDAELADDGAHTPVLDEVNRPGFPGDCTR